MNNTTYKLCYDYLNYSHTEEVDTSTDLTYIKQRFDEVVQETIQSDNDDEIDSWVIERWEDDEFVQSVERHVFNEIETESSD